MVYKRSEKRPKEVKKRVNLIEKQKAHEKIGQLLRIKPKNYNKCDGA
jgi:hypothetical protein